MLVKDLLQELTGVKKFRTQGKFQTLQAFKEAGGRVFSDGRFSVVLTHPKWDHVWKTFVNDPGYMHYLSIIKANPSNPHFPKIGKVKKIVPPFRRFKNQPFMWAVKMENLQPISSSNWKIVKAVLNVYNHWTSSQQFHEKYPQYTQLFDAIFEVIGNRGGNILDLEERNFMQRRDGTIVMTDPLWDVQNEVPFDSGTLDGGELPEGLT